MTYPNAKGQVCEDPAEVQARKAAFVQNEIEDIEAAARQRMVGSLLLGCAILLGALIGAGGMWHYMHSDLATGYRLGRKSVTDEILKAPVNCYSIDANTGAVIYALCAKGTSTAQGSEVKR